MQTSKFRYRRNVTRRKDLEKKRSLIDDLMQPIFLLPNFLQCPDACLPSLSNKHQSSIVVTSEKALSIKGLSLHHTQSHPRTRFLSFTLCLKHTRTHLHTSTHSLFISLTHTHTHTHTHTLYHFPLSFLDPFVMIVNLFCREEYEISEQTSDYILFALQGSISKTLK